jgi:nucleoside diphosphate kinase
MRRIISTGFAVGAVSVYGAVQSRPTAGQTCAFAPKQAFCDAKGTAHTTGSNGRSPLQRNYAFVFIKPHANTGQTRSLVTDTFRSKGVKILSEGEITAEQIDKNMYIDQHYYAIASKATLLKPKELPPKSFESKFEDKFKETWADALKANTLYNAIDACKHFGVDTAGITALWDKAAKEKNLVKLGGGFYCARLEAPGKEPIYVLNGFFMSMRNQFVEPGTSIHFYNVEFDAEEMPWADFRGALLGPTNPADAPKGSLRGLIFKDWKTLGLSNVPNTGENGVHASASPFEALAERSNWLGVAPEADLFGARLITETGMPKDKIAAWSVDPQVNGKSIFDQLEDLDSAECIAKMKKLM